MASDIQAQHPVFLKTPPAWHPYIKLARLDRPIGTWLLLLPCWWGIVLSHGGIVNMDIGGWRNMFLFALGALLMRSAGCVVNDLWDRNLDQQVERTRTRPLAAGEISVKQVLIFLAALLAPAFLILLTLPKLDIALGFAALLLVGVYPLMKRVTWWPQLFLGFTFNWGALMGWAATDGTLAAPALWLYAGGIFWTLAYDTIYAHQDKEDDALIGVRSTARLFGDKSAVYVSVFYVAALTCWIIAKYLASPSIMTPMLTLPVIAHMIWQLRVWDMHNPANCLMIFRSSRNFGLLVLLLLGL